VIQVADVERLSRRNAGPCGKRDRVLGNQLRVGPDERVVRTRFAAEPFDGRDGVRDGIVLVAVADIGPGENLFTCRRRCSLLARNPNAHDDRGGDRDTQ
jgi:hypothetical protein